MRAFLIVATSLVSLLAQSAPRVTSVRLYVFDCGVLVRGEPTAYGLTKEQVGDTNVADACYLVAHPKVRSSGTSASFPTPKLRRVE